MPLYRPTELIAFLRSIGVEPRRSLSQNFLIDGNVICKIVKASHIEPGDPILEIGPGPGALTEALLAKGAFVVAVEADKTLAKQLHRLQTPDKRLEVVEADALKVPIPTLYGKFPSLATPIKLFGNLPYHITTPLLARFIEELSISQIIIMVQEEVARRMCAKPATSDYSSLTVFLNFYAKTRYLFRVSRRCFYPSPKVDSAVVALDLIPNNYSCDPTTFFKTTRHAFEQKRKALRNSLRDLYPTEGAIEKALVDIALSPLARPEELSIEKWVRLFQRLSDLNTQ